MAPAEDLALRCAVHPSLPAEDECPVCRRPRCAGDAAAAPGGGCLACEGKRPRRGPPPLDPRALVAAAALANPVAILTGLIASEYVGAGWIGYAVPVFVGILVSIAAEHGAGKKRGNALRWLAAGYSVLAIAVGMDQPRASGSLFALEPHIAVPYLLAPLTSWLWTAPPRVVTRSGSEA